MLVERGVLSLAERKSSYSLQNDFISTGGEHPSTSSSPFTIQKRGGTDRKESLFVKLGIVFEELKLFVFTHHRSTLPTIRNSFRSLTLRLHKLLAC